VIIGSGEAEPLGGLGPAVVLTWVEADLAPRKLGKGG
jgi:hypothetical protein